jgi:2-hydroxy-6-oxonona-2,4-dienedioate hydrolase
MARIAINGIEIEYELLGPDGAPAVVVTPGGRFPKDDPGVPELGRALAAGGKRVLLWDRPNCGSSDISFDGKSESDLSARTLIGLIHALKLGPTALTAGSAGSRVSLIAASHDPSAVSHLVLWWISGGPISLASLANYYTADSGIAASQGGMEAVAALPGWQQQIQRNPRNRDILLRQDPEQFIERMQQWAYAYAYSEQSPVPGMSPADFAKLKMPVLIFRSGKSDLHHTRRTSEWVHEIIPHSKLVEPPWADTEWNERSMVPPGPNRALFGSWPKLAPLILDFTATS